MHNRNATTKKKSHSEEYVVSDKILTIPNMISFIRLCLIPVFFILLFDGHDIAATFLFAVAAGTDWIDGQVARKTNSVSKLGQLLDPAVDRILILSGVVGLLLVDRIPMWIVVFLIARDGLMLLGGAYLLKKYQLRIPVIFAGKAATASLLVGFVGLLLNWPLIPGLGVTAISWLPGFNHALVSWSIWFVYIGLALSLVTAVYYLYTAYRGIQVQRQTVDRSST